MKLVIYIPTYNRSSLLLRQLETLKVYHGADEITVIVRDNHSMQPEYEGVREYCQKAGFEYSRNICNIGGNPNIMDGFMLCGRGDYLWILSDDDLLRPDAVESVFKLLHRPLACDILYLMHEQSAEREVALDQSQLYAIQNYGLGLISRVIYRSGFVLPHIRSGYENIVSCFAHLAVLYQATKQNGVVHVCKAFYKDIFLEGGARPVEPNCYNFSLYGYTLLAYNLERSLRKKFLTQWWKGSWLAVGCDRGDIAPVQEAACFRLVGQYVPLFCLQVRLLRLARVLGRPLFRLYRKVRAGR